MTRTNVALPATTLCLAMTLCVALTACSSGGGEGEKGATADSGTAGDGAGVLDTSVDARDAGLQDTGEPVDAASGDGTGSDGGTETDEGVAGSSDDGAGDGSAGDGGVAAEFQKPCDNNEDCDSGYCIIAAAGKVCTVTCVSSCPAGWNCVAAPGVDGAYVCVDPFTMLCKPCGQDADCRPYKYLKSGDRCIGLGVSGRYCGKACKGEVDCPEGYACKSVKALDGSLSLQCVPPVGGCACTDATEGQQTICVQKTEYGACEGKRSCSGGMWSPCDAKAPSAEVCNGQDDDCDGLVDEDIAALPCQVSNSVGICKGSQTCKAGKVGCDAPLPKTESCDGIDNDCDGLVDEGLGTFACGTGVCKHQVPKCGGGQIRSCEDPEAGSSAELCNGLDDDCDGQIDELADLGKLYCGIGACRHAIPACTAGKSTACDAMTGARAEVCNGIDDDCDGLTDEGLPELSCGLGKCAHTGPSCEDGKTLKCDPFLGQQDEACNGIDDDCNGKTDELWPKLGTACDGALDADHCAGGSRVCDADGKGISCVGDFTFKTEACNGKDDDCNGKTDEHGAVGCTPFYIDKDHDGYGSAVLPPSCRCQATGAYVASIAGDCNDANKEISPSAKEVCNGRDDNCNGFIDEGVKKTFFLDQDHDGWGTAVDKAACKAPAGFVGRSGDCNDFNKGISPGAKEQCNDVDDNCDGQVDEGLARVSLARDLDGDGHGAKGGVSLKKCLGKDGKAPVGWSLVADDCNDSAANIHPGAEELCDGILNDCNGQVKDFACPTRCPGKWPADTGTGLGYVHIAQLDGDNEWEVAAMGSKGVVVLEHDGSVKWRKGAAGSYSYLGMADVNNDNWMDIVYRNGGAIQALDGRTGKVVLDAPVGLSSSSSYRTGNLADIDGDGAVDIVTMEAGATHKLVLLDCEHCPGKVGIKKIIDLKAKGPASFYYARPLVADLNGDGVAEIALGSGGPNTCKPGVSCLGRMHVFNADGSLYVNPLTYFDNKAASKWNYMLSWPLYADFDGDGANDVGIYAGRLGGAPGGGTFAWSKDGTKLLSGVSLSARSVLAPLDATGKLDPKGVLRDVGGPVVDLDGDGRWEVLAESSKGFVVKRGGKRMDGYPFGVAPTGALSVADLNIDGRLDVIYVSGHNLKVNCYTLGPQTWDRQRVFNYGTMEGLGRMYYPTGGFDPYEPNDVRNKTFDPKKSIHPIRDSRAWALAPFKAGYNSNSSAWIREVRGLISEKGDRDYFYVKGTLEAPRLSALTDNIRFDLYMHIYVKSGGAYKYLKSLSNTDKTRDKLVQCHPSNCFPEAPQYNGAWKLFIIEIRGHDENKDFGPWPYILGDFWGQN